MLTKSEKQLLALTRAARNQKYRPKVKAKIKAIKQNIAHNNWLAQ